jgi:hypothetical protein
VTQGSAGTGDVTLISDTGAVITLEAGFEYLEQGGIDSVEPARGQEGTYASISGSNLLGGGSSFTSVSLCGVEVSDIIDQSDTKIDVRVAVIEEETPLVGDVVLVSDLGAIVTLANGFKYNNPSTIDSVSPSSGQVGTNVDISGENLLGVDDGEAIVKVLLGATEATIAEGTSQTLIKVVVQSSEAVANADVRIEADSGAVATKENAWQYLSAARITGVSPAYGQIGTVVTISGVHLLGGGTEVVSVSLAGTEAATIQSSKNEAVVVIVAAADAIQGAITMVSDTGAIVTLADGWTQKAEGEITSVVPGHGQYGTSITIEGTNLQGHGSEVVSVTLAGVPADIDSESDSAVVVVADASVAKTGAVILTTDSGAVVRLAGGFEYRTQGDIETLTPSSGQVSTNVKIAGSNLLAHGESLASVTLGGVEVADIVSAADDEIEVVAAAGPAVETVGDVVITADTGAEITSSGGWKYLQPGKVSTVNPAQGRVNSKVTIFGNNLCGGGDAVVKVTLIGLEAELDDVSNCDLITVIAQDYGANAQGDVVIVGDTGAVTVGENAWTYMAEGEITAVEPSAGQDGALVTITGKSLFGGSDGVEKVSLADVDAFVLEGATDTEIVVRVFPGPSEGGTGDVVITGNSGVHVRLVDGFTYSGIVSVTPNYGQRSTRVVIEGVALFAGGSSVVEVRLAEVVVTEVTKATDTSISVVADFENVFKEQAGDVAILMDNGQVTTGTNMWTYKLPGIVKSVSPSSGQLNTKVTIAGENLLQYGTEFVSVTLAGVAPEVLEWSDTELVVVAGASDAVLGDIVLVSETGSTVIHTDSWEYVTVAKINSVAPENGQYNTQVTISGSDMYGGGANAADVTLGGVSVSSIDKDTASEIIVTAADAPSYNICDIVCDGTCETCGTAAGDSCKSCPIARRLQPSGWCTSICPDGTFRDSGVVTMNAVIDFTGVQADLFDDAQQDLLAATLKTAIGAQIDAIVAGAAPALDSVDTTVDPVVNSVAAQGGSVGSDIDVTVTVDHMFYEDIADILTDMVGDGTLLDALKSASTAYFYVTSLDFTTAASRSTENICTACNSGCATCIGPSDSECAACADGQHRYERQCVDDCPADTFLDLNDDICKPVDCEVADVVVTADTGAQVTSSNSWRYLARGQIVDVSPSSGQESTPVTITGTNLRGGADNIVKVTLGGVEAQLDSESATEVSVIVNANGNDGAGDIILQASSGALVTAEGAWTQLAAAAISELSPAEGQAGSVITISGSNLLMGGSEITSVTIGSIEVNKIVSYSDDAVVVVLEDSLQLIGPAETRLLSDTGAFTIKAADAFTYLERGAINSVTPANGQIGTEVVIAGERLLGGGDSFASVHFGDIEVTIDDASDDSTLKVTNVGGGAVGDSVDITIVSNTGATVLGASAWTELAEGSIDAVSPESGQQGAMVTLTGSGLLGGGSDLVSVTLAGTEVDEFDASSGKVTVKAGSADAGSGDIVLIADTGAVITATDAWEYVSVAKITGAEPASGQTRTLVGISGEGLQSGADEIVKVSLGATEAAIVTQSDSKVNVIVQHSADQLNEAVDITITTSSGAYVVGSNQWTYLERAEIESVTPAGGIGGTRVAISGQRLLGGGASLSSVTLAGVEVEKIESYNNDLIEVHAATSAAGSGDVVITANTGAIITTATNSDVSGFEYFEPSVITAVTPSIGQYNTAVVITGERLLGDGTDLVSLTLAGVAVKEVVSKSATEVSVIADGASAQTGDVLFVSDTGGRVTAADGWTYGAEPSILAITPGSGNEGTEVSVYGVALRAHGNFVDTVTLAGTDATIVEQNDLFVTVTVAAADAGTGDVVLTSDSGATVTSENGWEYVAPAAITSVTPAAGQTGSAVRIEGTTLLAGGSEIIEVTLGGVKATITSQTDELVVVTANSGVTLGLGDIKFTIDTGAFVVAKDSWTYLVAGDINLVNPSSGQHGTHVSIHGVGLFGGGDGIASVTLAGVEAESRDTVSDELIEVVAAEADASTGDVKIVADSGAVTIRTDGWTQVTKGTIDEAVPASGQRATNIEIKGSGMLSGGDSIDSVTLDGVEVWKVFDASDSSVLVSAGRSESASDSAGDITMVANTGAHITKENAFTYIEEGAIDDVSPALGQGGTYVTISGVTLQGGGTEVVQVTLAGTTAEIVSESDSEVKVRAAVAGAGQGHVVLTSESGALVTLENGFTYAEPGIVESITPAVGQLNTLVTIEGERLSGSGDSVETVTLSGVEAAIESQDASKVVVTADASAGAAGDVVTLLSVSGAVVTVSGKWNYATEGSVSDVTPANGQYGTIVAISGTSLRGSGDEVVSVTLAGTPVLSLDSETNDRVEVVADHAGAVADGDIVLTADTGATVTAEGAWTQVAEGEVSSVTPDNGQYGTKIDIAGTGLLGAGTTVASVSLGGVAVETLVSQSDTLIQVVAAHANPADASTTVVITADSGAIVTADSAWQYLERGVIDSLTPASGQLGTVVTIAGARMFGGGSSLDSVSLAGVSANIDQDASRADEVVVTVTQGSAGTGDVTLISDTGAVITLEAGFEYLEQGVVTLVSPSRGQLGTIVKVHGERLLGGGSSLRSITFNGVAPLEVVSATDTVITVRIAESLDLGMGDVVIESDSSAIVSDVNGWIYDVPSEIVDVCVNPK